MNQSFKNMLLSASAKALKVCMKSMYTWSLSYKDLHELSGRATPEKMTTYKLALQLYKTFNNRVPSADWIRININIINTSRKTKFSINKTNRLKIGMNVLSNRFWHLNGMLDLKWFNLSFNSFKINCKRLLLK